jgi:hypothetical protein
LPQAKRDVQHADVKLITRYWLPAAAATAVSIGLVAPAYALSDQQQTATHFSLSPMSQQNAIRKAQDYLNYTAYSRQGLITQLVDAEQFSEDDATYAVDGLNVDWNLQAAKKAEQYLDYTAYSHGGLLNQLIDGEHFTPSQAAYGVNAAGL